MAKRKNPSSSSQSPSPSPSSSDRRQWRRIFRTLVNMLQSQQSQIETLASERKFLEKYIHLQHERWSSREGLLESHIAQLKKDAAKVRKIEAAKLDLMVGLKQREAFCCRKQLEVAETDLEDFHECVETLGAEFAELKERLIRTREPLKAVSGDGDTRSVSNPEGRKQPTLALEGEIKKLKLSYKKLSSKKEAEVSGLLAEKDFAWNQLKKMEGDYIGALKSKGIEIQDANEAIGKLQCKLEELQTSASQKDEVIAQLNARIELDMRLHAQEAEGANEKIEQYQLNIGELHSLIREKDGSIEKLRNELAKLETDMPKHTVRRSRFFQGSNSQSNLKNTSVTPTRRNLREGSRKRRSESAKNDANQKQRCVYDGSSRGKMSAPVRGLDHCSSRRRTRTGSSIEEPVLFHAKFKVPKLKNSSAVV